MKSKAVCIAYETIEKENGSLPLLVLMSKVAGAKAPRLLTQDMLKEMKDGSVIVDVASDVSRQINKAKK